MSPALSPKLSCGGNKGRLKAIEVLDSMCGYPGTRGPCQRPSRSTCPYHQPTNGTGIEPSPPRAHNKGKVAVIDTGGTTKISLHTPVGGSHTEDKGDTTATMGPTATESTASRIEGGVDSDGDDLVNIEAIRRNICSVRDREVTDDGFCYLVQYTDEHQCIREAWLAEEFLDEELMTGYQRQRLLNILLDQSSPDTGGPNLTLGLAKLLSNGDDCRAVSKILSLMLRSAGYECVVGVTGSEQLATIVAVGLHLGFVQLELFIAEYYQAEAHELEKRHSELFTMNETKYVLSTYSAEAALRGKKVLLIVPPSCDPQLVCAAKSLLNTCKGELALCTDILSALRDQV